MKRLLEVKIIFDNTVFLSSLFPGSGRQSGHRGSREVPQSSIRAHHGRLSRRRRMASEERRRDLLYGSRVRPWRRTRSPLRWCTDFDPETSLRCG